MCFHIRELWQKHCPQGEKEKDMSSLLSLAQNWNKDWQWWWGNKTICRWQLPWLLHKKKKSLKNIQKALYVKKPITCQKTNLFLLWVWRSDLDYRMHKKIAQIAKEHRNIYDSLTVFFTEAKLTVLLILKNVVQILV